MMSNNVRVSVIIPCFNHGQFIMDAISSVEACPDDIYEIIIVNDGSTDPNTCEVMENLKQKGYFVIEQENSGLGAARNSGIHAAKGEYILPLDADNKIRSNYIYKGIEILDEFPEVGVVYGNAEYFGEKTGLWKIPNFDLSEMILWNYIDACAVFRKSIWENYQYDTNIYGYEDWDFWLGVAKAGWKFYHVPEVLFDYRVRSDSMLATVNIPQNYQNLIQYISAKHIELFRVEYRQLYYKLKSLNIFLEKTHLHYLYRVYLKLRKMGII